MIILPVVADVGRCGAGVHLHFRQICYLLSKLVCLFYSTLNPPVESTLSGRSSLLGLKLGFNIVKAHLGRLTGIELPDILLCKLFLGDLIPRVPQVFRLGFFFQKNPWLLAKKSTAQCFSILNWVFRWSFCRLKGFLSEQVLGLAHFVDELRCLRSF